MKSLISTPNEADAPPAARRPRLSLVVTIFLVLCATFGVALPKGGVVAGGIPITWGYLLLGGAAVGSLVAGLLSGRFRMPKRYLIAYALTLPFVGIVLGTFLIQGWRQTAFAAALLTNVAVLPFLFLVALSSFFGNSRAVPVLLRMIRGAVIFAAIYGLVLFGYKQATGRFFEVPFLTTNGQQETTLEKKHNARGDISKLISTYNNGNIYGVCTLMLLPLCGAVGGAWYGMIAPYLAIFLTLSRTSWAGIFIIALLRMLQLDRKTLSRIVVGLIASLLVIFCISIYLHIAGKGWDWVFDSNLGGRIEQVESVSQIDQLTFLPSGKFDIIPEMTYIGMVNSFGVLGLICYLVAMVGPLVVAFSGIPQGEDRSIQRAAIKGAFVYLMISALDGAYLLIPVMAFYWFLVALSLRRESARME